MKSEFHVPKTLQKEKAEPSIRVDAGNLLGLLFRAELMMNKVDRIRYSTRAINAIQDIIAEFSLAYDFEDDRLLHLKRLWGHTAVFLQIMRTIGEQNAIRIQPKYETMTPDQMKLELLRLTSSLDEGVTKWKNSIVNQRNKGTTRADGRNGQPPEE